MSWAQVMFIVEELSKKINNLQIDIDKIKQKLNIEEEE